MAVSCLIILGVGYYFADQRIVGKGIYASFDHAVYESVYEISNKSDLIVEVTATNNTKEKVAMIANNQIQDRYSVTQVKVDKIIKDPSNTILVNDSLPIIELFFTVDQGIKPGKEKLFGEEYTALVPGSKYVLFLNWSEKRNAYWIDAVNQGKINIDGTDKAEEELANQNESFKKLKDSVIKKHSNPQQI